MPSQNVRAASSDDIRAGEMFSTIVDGTKLLLSRVDGEAKGVIDKGFQQFVNNYIMQFELATKVPICFVGSIAHYLRDELTTVLERNDLIVGVIRQRPIEGLVDFHKANL